MAAGVPRQGIDIAGVPAQRLRLRERAVRLAPHLHGLVLRRAEQRAAAGVPRQGLDRAGVPRQRLRLRERAVRLDSSVSLITTSYRAPPPRGWR